MDYVKGGSPMTLKTYGDLEPGDTFIFPDDSPDNLTVVRLKDDSGGYTWLNDGDYRGSISENELVRPVDVVYGFRGAGG